MRFASRPPQRSHHRHQTPPATRTVATLITQFSKDLEQVRKEEILLSPVSLDRSPGATPGKKVRPVQNGLSPWGARGLGSALRLPALSGSVVPVSPCIGQSSGAQGPRWKNARLNGGGPAGNGARRDGLAARRRAPGVPSTGRRRAGANEQLVGFMSMKESTVAFGALSSELKRKRPREEDREKKERKKRRAERAMEEREKEREKQREGTKKRKRERAREREKEDERDRRRETRNEHEVVERGKERKREKDKDYRREKDRRRERDRDRDRRKERDPIKDSTRSKESDRRADKREKRERKRNEDSDAESSGESEKRTELREKDKRRPSDRQRYAERARPSGKDRRESEERTRDQRDLLRGEKEKRDRRERERHRERERERYREKEERREKAESRSNEQRRKDLADREKAEERRDRKREERKHDLVESSKTSPVEPRKRKRGESRSPQEEPERRVDRVKLRSSPLSPSREERRSSESDSSREKNAERPSITSKGDKLLSSTRTSQPRISLRSGASPNNSSSDKYRSERPRQVTPSKRKSAFAPVDESELEYESRAKRPMYGNNHYGDSEREHISKHGARPPSGRDRQYRSPPGGSDGSPSKNGGNAFSGLRSKSVSPGHQRATPSRGQLPRSTTMHPWDRPRKEAATPPGEHAGTPAFSPPEMVDRSADQKTVSPPSGKSAIAVPVPSVVDGTDVIDARSAFLSQKAEFDELMEKKDYRKAESMALDVLRKGFAWALAKETQFRKGRTNVIRDLPANVRNKQTGECISVYYYIASGFAKIASNEFENLGRRSIAVTLRRHLSKAYGRMFLLQRIWDMEKRGMMRELSSKIKAAAGSPEAERTGWAKMHTRDLRQLMITVDDYLSGMSYYDLAIRDGDDGGEAAGGECRIM